MINLQPINKNNWEDCLNLAVTPQQSQFIPTNVYSLAQAKVYETCEPFGIYNTQTLIGFVMVARFSGIYWISRLMIDQRFQGQGFGKQALEKAVHLLKKRIGTAEIRTSIAKQNIIGLQLFKSIGFQPLTLENNDTEIVLRWATKEEEW